MLTFMNSKLPDDWQISDKQYHIFQKSKSYEISKTDIYIGEDLEFIIHVFYCCIYPIRPWHLLNVNKKHLSWLKLYLVLISGIKSQQAKKPFVIQYQNLLIFLRIPLVHFIKSFFWSFNFMCAFNWLTEWKLQKLKNIWKKYLIHEKAFKKNIKYYTSKDKCPNFTNFFTMSKINNSNLSNEKQKELKINLGQLQEKISKASLPISAV